jgi:ribonuclease HI
MMRGIGPEWKDSDAAARLRAQRRPRSYRPPQHLATAFQRLLEEELREGIVEEIEEDQAAWFNPTFLVEKKKKGEYRKVLDCRDLNAELTEVHFKMEGPDTVCQLIATGDWATSIDIKSAFNHVPVDPALKPYLAFQFGKRTYTYVSMPFGIRHAPRIFTLILRKAIQVIRDQMKVRTVAYMDDILLLFSDAETALTQTRNVATFLETLGWTLAPDKCELQPVQNITFLGWRWHLQHALVSSTPARRTALKQMLTNWQSYARDREPRPVRELATLLGELNFMRLQVPEGALHTKRLDSTKARAARTQGWDGTCTPNPSLMGELKWWNKTLTVNEPRRVIQYPVAAILTTDASPGGWGAVLMVEQESIYGFGGWTLPQRAMTSNAKELVAVRMGLEHFKGEIAPLTPCSVLIRSDNATTVADINRKTATETLAPHLLQLLTIARQMQVQLQSVHVAGVRNEEADRLSRIGTRREYYLKPEYFQRVTEALQFQPELDAFAATPYLPSEVTVEHLADALRCPWTGKRLLILPPPCLVTRAVSKAHREKVQAIMILPAWKGQPWEASLREIELTRVTLGAYQTVMTTTPRFLREGWKLPPGDVLAITVGMKMTRGPDFSKGC